MTWQPYDTWMVAIAALAAVNCALLGNFLVLRRLSMMGDAISHSVLPGLAVALIVAAWLAEGGAPGTGDTTAVNPTAMFIGAAVVGVLTAVLVQFVHRGGVDEGASMGVVFTSLFAVGLVVMRQAVDKYKVDLDPDCVLFGQLAYAPLAQGLSLSWLSADGGFLAEALGPHVPRAAVVLGGMLVVNAAFVLLLFKELRLTSFDPALADTLGFRSGLVHYATMTLVAMTAVAAFESVGSILVVALLIAPAATAQILTRRLVPMVVVGVLLAIASAVLGYVFSYTVPASLGHAGFNTAGMIAVVAGAVFALAVIVEPERGVVGQLARRWALAVRTAEEDVLAVLFRREERGDLSPPVPRNTRGIVGWRACRRLAAAGRARWEGRRLVLTDAGRRSAGTLVRSHRLWERYMADAVGVPPDHTHAPAERLEHVTDALLRGKLAAETAARLDPHGRRIPEPE